MCRKLLSLSLIVFFSLQLSAQVSLPVAELYTGGAIGSGDTKPFWNVSNQYGRYSLEPFEGVTGLKVVSKDSSDTFFHVDYGLEVFGRYNGNPGFFLQQGYAQVRTPFLLFRAGMKEGEAIGSQDSLLSIGSTVWSRNARPMPKLVIATPGYIDVPYTKGYVEVNGSLAHGWFEEARYVDNVYLHQKHVHVRAGGDLFINFSMGFLHFAQWGGFSSDPRYGKLPNDIEAYLKVFFAQQGDTTNAPPGEAINVLGNHLGSRTYRLDIKLNTINVGMYFQTIFEDGSGMVMPFFKDNLKGISIQSKDPKKIVNRLVFEYLHTTFQSGPYHIIPLKMIGNDNYFNNGIYRNGWTYKSMTIGTPLITSPVYNEEEEIKIMNNRVLALHLGLGGQVKSIGYKTYFTLSKNFGTFSNPIIPIKNQFSWYLETTFPSLFYGIDLNVMLAADIGEMYGDNFGAILLLRRRVEFQR